MAVMREIAWTPGSSRIDGHRAENITQAISSQSPADKYDLINKTSVFLPDSGRFMNPDIQFWITVNGYALFIQISFRAR
nr:hypothetical protein [Escherichia coli]